MKKKYILILELETRINEKIADAKKEQSGCYNSLLQEVLKNNKIIRDLYWLWLISELSNSNHIYEMSQNVAQLKEKDELEILKPLLKNLPEETKEYFLKVFQATDEKRDEFFETFFSQFDTLKVTKANFIEKGQAAEKTLN